MRTDVVWSESARRELLDLYVTIGLHNEAAAERIYDRIEQRARQVARHPRPGPERPDIRSGLRALVEPAYLLLCEIRPNTDDEPVVVVEIVSIVDGRRDLFD